MSTLTKEIQAYEAMLEKLETDHFGKWVVFHDEELEGIYESFDEAAQESIKKYGRGPYLIRKVGEAPITLPASVMYHPV